MSAFRRLLCRTFAGRYRKLNITEIGKQIRQGSAFTERYQSFLARAGAAVLIASSCATSGLDKSAVPRVNVDKTNPKGNLVGAKVDVANMYQLFMKTKVIKVHATFDSIGHETGTTRSDILTSIQRMFDDTDESIFILYYSGHGTTDGDWCFEERDKSANGMVTHITLNDILCSWNNRPIEDGKQQKLIIIADCCYSGAWVDAIQNTQNSKEIIIQSSCGANEVCYDGSSGGVFTNSYKNTCIRYVPSDPVLSDIFGVIVGFSLYCVLNIPNMIVTPLYILATSKFTPSSNANGIITLGTHDGYKFDMLSVDGWFEMSDWNLSHDVMYVCTLGSISQI
eukprot:32808_1